MVYEDCEQLCNELENLLDGKMSIMKNKDAIVDNAKKLSRIVKKFNESLSSRAVRYIRSVKSSLLH